MFKTLRNALEIPDVRKKLLFTCFMLVVVRIGCQIPTPGINTAFVKAWWEGQTSTAFNFFNTITGSSFTTMSIFALSISPYITSSIIVQLLTIAIPKLEELQKEGEEGRKKIQQVTRVLTVALALIQSVSMAIGFGSNYLNKYTWYNVLLVAIIMTAGSAVLMWIGERITARGVGNGISMILLFNIISGLPDDLMTMYKTFVKGKNIAFGIVITVVILALLFALVVYVVYLQDGERRISVQYAKKMQGRKMVGGQSSHIPMKVNTAGVIPVIFASSLMSMPSIIAAFMGRGNGNGIGSKILKGLSQQNWFSLSNPVYTLGFVLYAVMIVFFAYFYTSITFNPIEVADNMKKQGGFIPGIRPGKPTQDYLEKILNYIIFIGAIGLLIVCTIPIVFNGAFGASVSFGGTSIIIIVGVVLETLKQIESQMLVRNYRGFLSE